jgi:putative FmdB family regulatory protein
MPVYEYECNACGDRFELRRKFSDDPVKECPKCGGEVTRLISSAAFKLKFRKYSKR